MAIDPVCFAIVDDDSARFTSTYKNRMYYFCTTYCKMKFDENPKNIHGQYAISILNQEELRAKRHRNGNTFF
jgi:YHS domain-containing protein